MEKRPPAPPSDPQLPGVPYPFTSENLRIAREQAIEYIAFAARNYPPQWAEQKIFQGAFRLKNIVASEYEVRARELVEDKQ
jgi:hypothetical protein